MSLSWGIVTRSDTNQDMRPQTMAKDLEFWIQEDKVMYYLWSKSKSTLVTVQ